MSPIILVPVVMVVAIGSVVGIRWLYNHTEGKKTSQNSVDEMTKNVDERTKNLANGGK